MTREIVTPDQASVPLSPAQLDIFIDQAIHRDIPLYNIGGYVVLHEAVDEAAFVAAYEAEMARHDAFELRYCASQGQPTQRIGAAPAPIALRDFSAQADPALAARAWLDAAFERNFDLEQGPLHWSALARIAPGQYWYCAVAHHLIIDGWGFGLWVKKLVARYLAQTGRAGAPEAPPTTFLHSVSERRARRAAKAPARQRPAGPGVWPAALLERRAGNLGHARSARVVRDLTPARFARLSGFAQAHGFEVHHFLMALLCLYFSALKQRTAWTIGLPSHNRRGAEKALIGSFVGVSPCVLAAAEGDTILVLMGMVRQALKECVRNQDLSITELTRLANAGGARTGRLFDIQFNYMKLDYQTDGAHLATATHYLANCWAQTPFSLNVCEFGSHQPTQLQVDVNLAYFSAADADAILDRLEFIADQVMDDCAQVLGAVQLVPPAELRRLTSELGNAAPTCVAQHDLGAAFAAVCARSPEAAALRLGDQTLSYAQLHGRALQLAHWLQRDTGDGAAPLAVCMRPALSTYVALLACALLRRPVVVLDPDYPVQRLEAILADAAPELVLTDACGELALARLAQRRCNLAAPQAVAAIDAMPATALAQAGPADPAHTPGWIIYTSGSTGLPKGVVLPQAAILRLAAAPNFMRLDADTVWLQASNLGFDMAIFEIWGTWLNGGTLVLQPSRQLDLDSLTRTLEACAVNTLWLTAGLFEKWLARLTHLPACLRFVMAGGDVVPAASVRKLLGFRDGVTFINGYGPTENGVFSTCSVITDPSQLGQSVPIGKPVNGSSAYVLGAGGQLQPLGEAGELWVGGAGLALGYLKQTALTQEKFVERAPGVGQRLYRTGDQVRWGADGQLEFLGRIDQQVKIRGFRIETGEIENCLRRHPDVLEAAVVALGDSAADKLLRAFVACAPAARDQLSAALPALLRAHLPEFMIPAHISLVDALPLNANGKVDRKALGATALAPDTGANASAAASATEAALWLLWQAVLPVAPTSTDGNFFRYGGHSLAAMQLVADVNARFGTALSVGDALRNPTIAQQAALIDAARAHGGAARAPLVPVACPAEIPMSLVQQQMWLSHQLNGGSHEYNVPGAFRVRGALDLDALEAALRALAGRHQTLSCTVDAGAAGAVLRAADPGALVLGRRDLSALPGAERDAALHAALEAERRTSFDLQRAPAMRACVLTLAPEHHVFLLTFHHIAIDGWSVAIICSELAQLYRSCRDGTAPALPALALGYHDFALAQHALAAHDATALSQHYWRQYLAGAPAVHELPLDAARPETASAEGRVLRATLAPHAAAQLDAVAAQHGVSLFTVLHGALAVLAGEYSGQRDVLIGTPVSGRHDSALHRLVGCFINTLVTRTSYQGDDTLAAVLCANQRRWSDSLAHHELPFARVLGALAPAQSRSVTPLFQLWFVLQSQETGLLALDGVELERIAGERANTKFDLMVSAAPGAAGLQIEWLYREDLFAAASMARMLEAYLGLLRALPDVLAVPVRQLPARLALPLSTLDAPMRTGYDATQCLADRVLEHAGAAPQALALADAGMTLTYAALAEQVLRLAALLAESGVGEGDCVGLCADRSIGGVIALLAIQHLGAAYLPLDPKLPAERAAFMLDDAGAALLLSYRALLDQLPTGSADVVLLDGAGSPGWLDDYRGGAAPRPRARADSAAYLIYTSGSSGTPKGVRVSRGNLAHYVHAMAERHDLGQPLRHAVNSAFHTDLGNTTLYLGLWFGGSLHLMAPALMLDGDAVSSYVSAQRIDVLKITPGHFAALCDDELYPAPVPARALIFGGEVLRRELLQAIGPACQARACKVINHYGPTEATIGCLTHELDLAALPAVAPLGLPLPGESVQVLAGGMAVPLGAWGELAVAGPAVSLGYHRRAELSAAVFCDLELPGRGPVRHYRTGDRVRINAAGLVEFGGRFDDQIKLRGFRIELAEIDSCLLRVPGVRQAVTLLYKDEAAQDALASFVVAERYDAALLQEALRRALPEYMLPKRLVGLAHMPLLGNGKPDRRALAAQLGGAAPSAYVAPATPTEIGIARVMRELLKLERLSADQRFFDAGGNSLLVTRLANELSLQMDLRIPVNLLMANHSVRTLAELADSLAMATSVQSGADDLIEIDI